MGISEHCRTIILGTGPAGLTAAIYAARAQLAPLVITGTQPGGQLTGTTEIENFPGFPDGIDGNELMDRMRRQAERFGACFFDGDAERVDLGSRPFRIFFADRSATCDSLIIATGATPRQLGLPGELDLYGRGVSVCATCDGFFYRDKEVAIVGGGDTAMEEAIFLTRFARKVTVIHRRDSLRASPPMQQRALENDKIEFLWNAAVSEILTDPAGVTGIRLRDTTNGEESQLDCDGLFVAIGHDPNTGLFKGQLDLNEEGFIITSKECQTSIPGVFAAGDVQDAHFRQAITAAGTGCKAAMQAERYLEEQ
ncbi:thioredoxin-disulfide reductase [Geothermobacter hydrogeniphilus]|uniref:Thioredoxin reductase n=1 Tax=Geothermobacter hydrogeniphilus TaxID=1969733 RepID=A0A1X0Y4W4_9BACT|nr:thioredoxin-disulfide reductase [Geothermobacter hydrogeniphilus]ORJ60240.1 thioredoxin-disulfide reductase [Geothermobacter hydrogeniphilus]